MIYFDYLSKMSKHSRFDSDIVFTSSTHQIRNFLLFLGIIINTSYQLQVFGLDTHLRLVKWQVAASVISAVDEDDRT